jgi:hypothetical protein
MAQGCAWAEQSSGPDASAELHPRLAGRPASDNKYPVNYIRSMCLGVGVLIVVFGEIAKLSPLSPSLSLSLSRPPGSPPDNIEQGLMQCTRIEYNQSHHRTEGACCSSCAVHQMDYAFICDVMMLLLLLWVDTGCPYGQPVSTART